MRSLPNRPPARSARGAPLLPPVSRPDSSGVSLGDPTAAARGRSDQPSGQQAGNTDQGPIDRRAPQDSLRGRSEMGDPELVGNRPEAILVEDSGLRGDRRHHCDGSSAQGHRHLSRWSHQRAEQAQCEPRQHRPLGMRVVPRRPEAHQEAGERAEAKGDEPSLDLGHGELRCEARGWSVWNFGCSTRASSIRRLAGQLSASFACRPALPSSTARVALHPGRGHQPIVGGCRLQRRRRLLRLLECGDFDLDPHSRVSKPGRDHHRGRPDRAEVPLQHRPAVGELTAIG